ncbi:MAG: flagellar basal body P-ring protein FlgI [Phycisphaerales bacterium]
MTTPRLLHVFALLALSAAVVSCGSSKRGSTRATGAITSARDVPAILRNTIGAECTLRGDQPVLVSGYGVVVGLDGKGSGDVPDNIRSVMERDLVSNGVGMERGPFRNFTPSQFIDHPDTAVVVVEAFVPPGAPEGARFDVQVRAFPGSSTKSIEGGQLYTTRLFRGLVSPLMPDTQSLAEAYGTVFINPFADPESARSNVNKRIGRVLDGGTVTESLPLMLFLDVPSHSRARAVAGAINTKFPRAVGDRLETAVGRTDEIVELNIPSRYRDNPEEFVQLVRHLRINPVDPDTFAVRYIRELKEFPELADNLSWCLRALGELAIPHVQSMYDYSEISPRMAALTAGAHLGDSSCRPYLIDVALNGPPQLRMSAVRLLGILPPDASINRFLREQIDSPSPEMRIAAYQALETRRDPWINRYRISGKFELHTVPSVDPFIFVTQTGAPRIVVFGDALEIERPVFVEAWDNRLMVNASESERAVNLYYLDERGRKHTGQISTDVVSLVRFLGHETTPETPAPGFDFTYSQVVGALDVIASGGGFEATIYPESDLLTLQLMRANQISDVQDRPEFSSDGPIDSIADLTKPKDENAATEKEPKRNYVVPLQSTKKTQEPDDR